MSAPMPLSWLGILRLGLVQTALGAIVVLTTSTLNRVMVVELTLPAMLPGALVALHYAMQLLRPRWGHGSDSGARLTPWIVGGMAVLALGGLIAAGATALMGGALLGGIVCAVAGFLLIGAGVGACGTSLLVLLAKRVTPRRRPAAATAVWLMMIAGMAGTAGAAGHFLDPFSPERLVTVTAVVCGLAFAVTVAALWRIEGAAPPAADAPAQRKPDFAEAFRQVWAEPAARAFTIFIFVSMLAYSAQDLILEPFAGIVFALTPGESTKLSGLQNGGVFIGMLLVAIIGSGLGRGSMRSWTMGGCAASAAALFALAAGGVIGQGWPLHGSVFALGLANGIFAVGAIGTMMERVGEGRQSREGVRMGLWGASQAVAFGLGGLSGAALSDVLRWLLGSPVAAYTAVFAVEGVLFLAAAGMAAQLGISTRHAGQRSLPGLAGPSIEPA